MKKIYTDVYKLDLALKTEIVHSVMFTGNSTLNSMLNEYCDKYNNSIEGVEFDDTIHVLINSPEQVQSTSRCNQLLLFQNNLHRELTFTCSFYKCFVCSLDGRS